MATRCRMLMVLLAVVVAVSACGQAGDDPGSGGSAGGGPGTASGQAGGQATADDRPPGADAEADAQVADLTRGPGDLVVWADERRAAALSPFAQGFAEEQGVTVAVQEIPFEQIRDQLQVAGPEGEGPDVVVGAHEWLGELVHGGLVTPVEIDDHADPFAAVAIEAVTYGGVSYGVPYALDAVALVRNTDLAPAAPATWEELEAAAAALQDGGTVERGLVLPADPPDPYHNFPMAAALGGYVFGRDAVGGYDTGDLGIDAPGGLDAARRFARWVEEGLVDPGVSEPLVQELFGAGDAAFAIAGPATALHGEHGFDRSGVAFAVTPIPPVDGGTARPLVGVEAVFVSAFAADPQLARMFVLDTVTTEAAQRALAEAAGRPSAHDALADAGGDPVLAGFGQSARLGVPLPAVPEVASVWGPWADAYERIYRQDGEPERAFVDAADEIRDLIGP